jgi:hypothetical protein
MVDTGFRATRWTGMILFAGVAIGTAGFFSLLAGVMALTHPESYTVPAGGTIAFTLTQWAWITIAVGLLQLIASVGLLTGTGWGRVIGVIAVVLNAFAHFPQIPQSPYWSGIVIVLDVLVLWALVAHGREMG